MNRGLSAGFQPDYVYSSNQLNRAAELVSLLVAAQVEEESIEQLEPISELCSFRLGDEIPGGSLVAHRLAANSSGQPDRTDRQRAESTYLDLYWISQGRIRLLAASSGADRETTAVLLNAAETFGADELFNAQVFPYRAVAASPVQLIRISAAALAPVLEQYPRLQRHLSSASQQQQRLIFFKAQTNLCSLSSHHLAQILPHISDRTIPRDTQLANDAEQHPGRYWLRGGQIGGSGDGSTKTSIPIGSAWGHPEPVPTDWVAQTDLQVYQLPMQVWPIVSSILPPSTATNTQTSPPSGAQSNPQAAGSALSDAPRPKLPVPRGSKGVNYLPATATPATATTFASSTEPVQFPKPTQRRLLDFLDRYPWIEQQSSSDCGAACLAMISQYWGKRVPLHLLREQANVGRAGASLKSLAKAAELLGYHALPVRASLGRMAEQSNPWIAHWEGTHYVVVYRVNRRRVIIADPALGRRSLSYEEFQSHWTGYALLLEPTERLQATEFKQASLGRYLGALLPYRSIALQIVLFSVLIQIFSMVTPLFTQIILDQVVVQKSLTTLHVFAIGLLLFNLWVLCLGSVRQYLLSYFSNRLDLTLIGGFIHHTLMLPLRFFESRRVGDIITRVQENQKIQRFLIQQVVLAWLNLVTGFLYLGLMLYYNWKLTLLVLGLIPPIVILTLAATPFLRKISREIFKEVADQSSVLVEMITGIATVKSAAAEQELRWRWEDHLTRQINAQFRGQKFGIGLQFASGLINSIGSTALLWFGASLVIQDQLTIGQFVAFNMMIGYIISPVLALVGLWDELQEVLISVERLNDVFETKPEESTERPLLVLPDIAGEVQFEDVTFRYNEDEEQNVLQNLCFRVNPGETIAIVGRSGSGKSTLVKLLEGLYYPTRGKVVIDGHDIRHVSPQSLRSQMGVVPQECYLFSGTILENITLYRPEYTLEQAIEVAKLAEAHAFIQSLPLGYNTKVGERGSSLSGGQRQRIAIARALLGDPRILILDEATSALDTESERRFQRNLTQIRRGRTTFVIAHRLSTVRNADRILVLDRGVLVEQGTHDELMTAQGLYYHLAQQQLNL
ncbi:MAG: peptidase domain-containing ABC transporter [Elainella sp. C42_A2020_010]|nr:peptidase domain-containing ABC transporter [Elainella sp. C42_A2020_010]